jgi:hypothetical protein
LILQCAGLPGEGQRPAAEIGGLRVVMPGDKHGGRYLRDVVKIEVK